jgi:hypothetical protein
MTPELGSAIRNDSSALVRARLLFAENSSNAPYWFVNKFEATHGEGVFQHLYDVSSMFSAKSMILKEPREELIKFLDVPAFARGDLFYIQNLVAAIEAESTPFTSAAIPLRSGWNLVALPVVPSDASPAALFAPIADRLVSVYAYDGCNTVDPWKRYDPTAPPLANDLTSIDVRTGLWIQANADVTWTVTGTAPTDLTVPLCKGQNLIGYPSLAPVSLPDALASIAGKYSRVYRYDSADSADPWKTFNPSAPAPTNDLIALGPGKGYWLDMTEPAMLQVSR